MRPRRILAAASAALMAVTMLGGQPAAGAANDNAPARWDGGRILKIASGDPDDALQLLGGRHQHWGLVARQVPTPQGARDQWLLQETDDDGETWGKPSGINVPAQVESFRAATSPYGDDTTYAAWVANGRLIAATRNNTEPGQYDSLGGATDLAPATPGGTSAPRVFAGGAPTFSGSISGRALIEFEGTWAQHVIGGTCGDCPGQRWRIYPAQDPSGGTASPMSITYAITGAATIDNGDILALWTTANGELRVARRDYENVDAPWSTPQTLAADGSKAIRYLDTAGGGRLVTQAGNGAVDVWTYTDRGDTFTINRGRRIGGPVTTGAAAPPTVLRDGLGTLTVGFQEPRVEGGGLVLWQEDRPWSRFLERPTLVPGTRDADAQVTLSGRGNIAVAVRRNDETGIVRVKHLPVGETKWTGGIRLVSPRPTNGAWALGTPGAHGAVRLAVDDARGVYGFSFNAPNPYTKVTKPVRTVQTKRRYTVAWNTIWAYANTWELRARVDNGKTYGPWKMFGAVTHERSLKVTRPRGETRCYQARDPHGRTPWSKQRCVTVRR